MLFVLVVLVSGQVRVAARRRTEEHALAAARDWNRTRLENVRAAVRIAHERAAGSCGRPRRRTRSLRDRAHTGCEQPEDDSEQKEQDQNPDDPREKRHAYEPPAPADPPPPDRGEPSALWPF